MLAAALSGATADEEPPHVGQAAVDSLVELCVPPSPHGCVCVIDVVRRTVLATLGAHKDVVRCMCALPDGRLATGGGKHDGTVRMWEPSQWQDVGTGQGASADEGAGAPVLATASQVLSEPGYVFAMTVCPDAKPGSQLFALACARYNTIKICL